jgi:hypothetical protein
MERERQRRGPAGTKKTREANLIVRAEPTKIVVRTLRWFPTAKQWKMRDGTPKFKDIDTNSVYQFYSWLS